MGLEWYVWGQVVGESYKTNNWTRNTALKSVEVSDQYQITVYQIGAIVKMLLKQGLAISHD